jgi:diazepam-binding inhibitor (GABA receptor modulating acyl-CoA-binding protein)
MELASEFDVVIKKLKGMNMDILNISDDIRLEFYKYYKQSTIGDCNISEPYTIFYKSHAKWEAWNSIKGMSTEDAMKNYISLYKTYIK